MKQNYVKKLKNLKKNIKWQTFSHNKLDLAKLKQKDKKDLPINTRSRI